MANPVAVILIGPSTDVDPFVEDDIRWFREVLARVGYRLVGYRGHWAMCHYVVAAVPGQS